MKIIEYMSGEELRGIKERIDIYSSLYDLPEYDEVIDWMAEHKYKGDFNKTMKDLIIQMVDEDLNVKINLFSNILWN